MIHRREVDAPIVALTFDDGPSLWTEQILDVLAESGARATFFVCGVAIQGREDTLRRCVAERHEVANHTHTHPGSIIDLHDAVPPQDRAPTPATRDETVRAVSLLLSWLAERGLASVTISELLSA